MNLGPRDGREGRRLDGKRILVTGAERGIGRALAIGCASEGAAVAVHYVDSEAAAKQAVSEIKGSGGRAVAVHADLSVPDQIESLLDDAQSSLGLIDVLINNAGVLIRKPFTETTRADFALTLGVDLVAPFLLSQLVARRLIDAGKGGSIINVSSISQERAAAGLVAYQCAKAGAWMLTRGLALELAPYHIRVNSIAPGTTVTSLNRDLLSIPDVARERLETIPLGRFGQPEDHVGAAVFYASDESSWITGTSLAVDGGITVR